MTVSALLAQVSVPTPSCTLATTPVSPLIKAGNWPQASLGRGSYKNHVADDYPCPVPYSDLLTRQTINFRISSPSGS
jgi:hypothetical protein